VNRSRRPQRKRAVPSKLEVLMQQHGEGFPPLCATFASGVFSSEEPDGLGFGLPLVLDGIAAGIAAQQRLAES
jgi:hypothetical protein